jgi:hypothetical protein
MSANRNDREKYKRRTKIVDPAPHVANVPQSYYGTSRTAIHSAGLFTRVPAEVLTYAVLVIFIVVKPSTGFCPFPLADVLLSGFPGFSTA